MLLNIHWRQASVFLRVFFSFRNRDFVGARTKIAKWPIQFKACWHFSNFVKMKSENCVRFIVSLNHFHSDRFGDIGHKQATHNHRFETELNIYFTPIFTHTTNTILNLKQISLNNWKWIQKWLIKKNWNWLVPFFFISAIIKSSALGSINQFDFFAPFFVLRQWKRKFSASMQKSTWNHRISFSRAFALISNAVL